MAGGLSGRRLEGRCIEDSASTSDIAGRVRSRFCVFMSTGRRCCAAPSRTGLERIRTGTEQVQVAHRIRVLGYFLGIK